MPHTGEDVRECTRESGMNEGDYLAGFGSAWERAPNTERLRRGPGCHHMHPAPNICQGIFLGRKI